MKRRMWSILVATPAFYCILPISAVAQANPCALLTSTEADKHIARGRPTYNQTPDLTQVGGGGAVCQYPHGQLGLWKAPNAEQNFEAFLKAWKVDKATRHPVSGVGDRAFIMFPVPESRYKDRAAYLVAHVGQQIVTVALFAHDGQSESSFAEHCRKNESKLRPNEKTDCARVLADKSETQESLQPAVVELAKIVVAKVRSGKAS
jgi:hypothetical protein